MQSRPEEMPADAGGGTGTEGQELTFHKRMFGYDPDEVDAFIAELTADYEDAVAALEDLRREKSDPARYAGLEVERILDEGRRAVDELRNSAAEEARRLREDAAAEAERTVTEARREAERMLEQARAEAERIVADARRRLVSLRDAEQALRERLAGAVAAAQEVLEGLDAAVDLDATAEHETVPEPPGTEATRRP